MTNSPDGLKPTYDLPPVLDLPAAAQLLGLGRTFAYQLVRRGEWPTPVIRIGRLIKVPTAPLRDLLAGRSVSDPARDPLSTAR